METLLFLAKLALALWFLYNVGVHAWRRLRTRTASERFRHIAGSGRALTGAERATLRAWLADPRQPGGVPELLREGRVFALDGAFARHGLRQQLGATMHDTLGGVDISLPYDAREFLAPSNAAEVVLTATCAVVITLNGRFDIAAGRARVVAANRRKFTAAHPDTPLPDIDPVLSATDLAMLGFEPLGQREETLAERAARSTTSCVDDAFIGCTLVLALVALVLGSSSPDDASLGWIAIGLALLAFGAWRWARSNALRAPQAVQRLRGRLSRTSLTNTPGPAGGMFRLGQRFSVDAPFHWTRFINPPALEPVDFEIRAVDGSVVRYRDALSIDAEATRLPHRPARSVIGVGLAATVALLVALGVDAHVATDFDCVRNGCGDLRWAAPRAGLVLAMLTLAIACALTLLLRRMAAVTRLRQLEALADERTRAGAAAASTETPA